MSKGMEHLKQWTYDHIILAKASMFRQIFKTEDAEQMELPRLFNVALFYRAG
jgi:hypothetical protein